MRRVLKCTLIRVQGILNFVILRPITAVMVMIAEASSAYHQGRFYPDNMWFWVTMINNISQVPWTCYYTLIELKLR